VAPGQQHRLHPELIAVMSTELSWRQKDLIARRDLLRANARGSRRMAEAFDAEADQCNAELEDRG
jgi:hypothetical protein